MEKFGRAHNQFCYPELIFGFPRHYTPEVPVEVMVCDVLVQLEAAQRFQMPTLLPEHVVTRQPSYDYNPNNTARFKKYLSHSVKIGQSSHRRRDVVDLVSAAHTIVDSLAELNHPVAQAITQFYIEVERLQPREIIDGVVIEVIVQTFQRDLKQVLQSQITAKS